MQLKVGSSAAEALKQIDDKGYALPYKAKGKDMVKVGVSFSKEIRSIKDWAVSR